MTSLTVVLDITLKTKPIIKKMVTEESFSRNEIAGTNKTLLQRLLKIISTQYVEYLIVPSIEIDRN